MLSEYGSATNYLTSLSAYVGWKPTTGRSWDPENTKMVVFFSDLWTQCRNISLEVYELAVYYIAYHMILIIRLPFISTSHEGVQRYIWMSQFYNIVYHNYVRYSCTILVFSNYIFSEDSVANAKYVKQCAELFHRRSSINPFSTETVLLVGYWSPITYTLLYTKLFI